MKIPTRADCLALYDEYAVPTPIRRHCRRVAQVALTISTRRSDASSVDHRLIERGCLVHDAFKAATLKELVAVPALGYTGPTELEKHQRDLLRDRFPNMHETLIAAEVLADQYPDFAAVVRLIGSTGNPAYVGAGFEVELIHYADWRVQFTEVVPFQQRLDYLGVTYASQWHDKGQDWWTSMLATELAIEQRIFSGVSFNSRELPQLVPDEALGLIPFDSFVGE